MQKKLEMVDPIPNCSRRALQLPPEESGVIKEVFPRDLRYRLVREGPSKRSEDLIGGVLEPSIVEGIGAKTGRA